MSEYIQHHQGAGGLPPQQPTPGPSKPTYSKRGKITIVACVPCRRRKTKCDGKRPACTQCQTRDSPCQYDMNEEQRRLTYLRENVETLAEDKTNLESFLWHLKSSTEHESQEILRRLRSGTDPQSLLQQIQASRSLTQVKGDNPPFSPNNPTSRTTYFPPINTPSPTASFERIIQAIATSKPVETDEIVHRLRRRDPLERIVETLDSRRFSSPTVPMDIDPPQLDGSSLAFHARPMAGNALAPQLTSTQPTLSNRAPDAHTPPNAEDYRWTTVTEESEFIEHLLNTYFMWQHAFFQNFPEKLFRDDYENGKTNYCSRVLVNAICAAGCLLSERPEARGDPYDPTTAGAGFFEEGMILLNRTDRSSIPTVAGVFLLSHVEGYRARLGAMWGLVGRSARMALDLNLHLRNDKMQFDQMPPAMQRAESGRIHAFWGCFVSDQVTALTLGRLPQILTNSITVELPSLDEEEDERPWGPPNSPSYRRPGARAITFRQCAALSKIVNSTLLMFFAPAQIIKGSLLLNEYRKYTNWYRQLPSMLSSTDNAPAHVISLHMYYQAAILLLFRPFLRASFTESPDITPADICRQAATAISDLFAKHFSLFGTTGMYTFHIQSLLAACTIHLINLPAIAAAGNLTAACNSFFHLIHRNTWAYGSIRLIRDLVRKWNIVLPGEVETALYPPHEELPPGILSRFTDPTAPIAELHRRDSTGSAGTGTGATKRAAFLNPAAQIVKRQRLAPVQTTETGSSSAAGTSESGEEEGVNKNFLFTPFANQPAPLLGPIHTSSTPDPEFGEDDVRKVTSDFDGMRFGGDGWFDPFMGI